LLLLGLLAVVSLAVVDARPLAIDGEARSGPLVVSTCLAGLLGFALARSRLGLIRAHAIGATIGGLVLLAVCSAAVNEGRLPGLDPASLLVDSATLNARMTAELERYLGSEQVAPTTLTLFLLGALLWTTGQASAFAVFRQQRSAPAVVATGGLLVLNEALPALEPAPDRVPVLAALAVYAMLALLLIVRLQLVAQRRQWARRHISDSGDVSRLFLRSGVGFVALAVVAATSLTALATVPPQRLDIEALGRPLEGVRTELARWLTVLDIEVPGVSPSGFDDRMAVPDTWQQGEGTAFEASVPGGLRGNYWWGSAFADFDGRSWRRDETSEETFAADEPIAVAVDASGAGATEISATLTPRAADVARRTALGANEVALVSEPVRVRSLGEQEGLAEILFADQLARGEPYLVTSFAHDYTPRAGSLTASQLRAAGTDYPAWIGPYTRVQDGASGPATRRMADRIRERRAAQGLENPYDMARLVQDTLRSYRYSPDVSGRCRADENVPECLLRTRVGFCLHYASTMAMILRELAIPARLVVGYLPGLDEGDGQYRVPLAALHAWVEVYFPGIGWVRFDPTPGGELRRFEQRPTDLAEGAAPASPDPLESFPPEDPLPTEDPLDEPSPSPDVAALAGVGAGGPDLAVLAVGSAAIAAGLMAVVALLLLLRLRRLPGTDGSLAFGRIASLAARLGHGRHPTQTEYEYAATLSDVLPTVRDDLFVVARASVEQRYAQRGPAEGAWAVLRRAYARVRVALLRLGLRARR
jgi:transglutaminase-like putative cysteine protease